MNKKLLLVLIATFLLTSCGGTKDDYIYEGPDSVDIEIFDYENSTALQEGLGTIFTINEQPISEQTLATFLSLIGTNDFYANKVIHTQKNQVLYPDPNDTNNFNSHRDGDVDYQIVNTFTRDNSTISISGTSVLHDEKWTTNELDPNILDHASINTTGAYSLQVSADGESFTESYDYLNDLYDQETQTRYENYQYYARTNLTNSSDISNHLIATIEYVDEQNETLSIANQFDVSFTASRNLTSFEVLYEAKSSRATVDEDILEVTYLINIQIAEGMIVNTTYLYTEIEKGSSDFLLKKVEDSRQYFVV